MLLSFTYFILHFSFLHLITLFLYLSHYHLYYYLPPTHSLSSLPYICSSMFQLPPSLSFMINDPSPFYLPLRPLDQCPTTNTSLPLPLLPLHQYPHPLSIISINTSKGTIDVLNPKDANNDVPRSFTFDAVYVIHR